MEAVNDSKVETKLLKMKMLLKKKEKRLSKYERALASKNHVRETLLKHNNIETAMAVDKELNNSSKNTSPSLKFTNIRRRKRPFSRCVKFFDNLSGISNSTSTSGENMKENESKESIPEKMNVESPPINFERRDTPKINSCNPFELSGFSPLITDSQKEHPVNDILFSNQKTHKKNVNVQLADSFKHCPGNAGTGDSFKTPVLSRSRRIHSLHKDKQHIKRLFSNETRNCEDYEIRNCLSQKTLSNDQARLRQQSLASSTDNILQSMKNFNSTNIADAVNLDCPNDKSASNITMNCENETYNHNISNNRNNSHLYSADKDYSESFHSSKAHNIKSICKIVSKTLGETTIGDNCGSCLTQCANNSPSALVLGTKGFLIWNLVEDENSPNNPDNHIWKRRCHQETDLCLSINSKWCVLGGGFKEESNFIIVVSPTEVGALNSIFVHFSANNKEVKVLKRALPVYGCSHCSFSGCRSKAWKFYLYVGPCKNAECSNNAKDSGSLVQVTFDLVYSKKKDEWETVFTLHKKTDVKDYDFLNITTLHTCYENNSGNEDDLLLWQDNLGVLGFSNGLSFSPIPKTGFSIELEKLLAGAVVLYAAAVKDILLLILKFEDKCKFVAVNPFTGQFDVFSSMVLQDLNLSSCVAPSVMFYEGKFYFLSSGGEMVSFSTSEKKSEHDR